MTPNDIEARVAEIIRSRRPELSFQAILDTPFTGLGIDSIELLNLVFEVEESFDISIPTEDLRRVQTTGELVLLVQSIVTGAESNKSLS